LNATVFSSATSRVVALVAGLGEPVEGVAAALDVSGVVLAVVQFQHLLAHRRLERAVVVGTWATCRQ
jgi:hypothetical protein